MNADWQSASEKRRAELADIAAAEQAQEREHAAYEARLAALERVIAALNADELAERHDAQIVAGVLEACLYSETKEGGDLVTALGLRVGRGGRFDRPGPKRDLEQKAQVGAKTLAAAPGKTGQARVAYVEQVKQMPSTSRTPEQQQMMADLVSAGLSGIKGRALLDHAKRGGLSLK